MYIIKIYLDIQASHDIVALSRFLREWNAGEDVLCYGLIKIYAEILAANSRLAASRALVAVRNRRVASGFFSDCGLKRRRYPNVIDYNTVDVQYSDAVKAFTYFHELFHLFKFRKRLQKEAPPSVDLDAEERECDLYAMEMIEELSEYYDLRWFINNCPAIIFSSVLINSFANHWSEFGDREKRSHILAGTIGRAVDATAAPLERFRINSRPFPSSAIPYIQQAKKEIVDARVSFEKVIAHVEEIFDEAAQDPDFDRSNLPKSGDHFWEWIGEIWESGDAELNALIENDAWMRMYSDTEGVGRAVALMFGKDEDDERTK